MIKLGRMTEQAINKQFPDNWKTMAIMMNIPFEMYDDDKVISIEISNTISIDIKADNSFSSNAPIPKELIAQLIVEAATLNDEAK